MGTLTGSDLRLPEQCEHKLPTSCRLSSIPNCCACADERAHAASYSTYIDGVGFVLRGNRWQRYCWFCKEFWEQRVRVSGLRSGQTRIPEVPDQTEFLNRWYEFHRGCRIVVKEDGTEERMAVLGENFKDVNPGCLPRTLEELRSGRSVAQETIQVQPNVGQEQSETGPSLEDTLEQMFVDASSEGREEQTQSENITSTPRPLLQETQEIPRTVNIHAQAMNPTGSRNREQQVRRVAALRRELNRMRNGIERVISGLRDLGEDVPNQTETTGRLTALGETLDTIGTPSREEASQVIQSVNAITVSATSLTQTDHTLATMQARVDEARTHMDEARRARDQAASELDLAEQEFRTAQHRCQQLQREQRTTENYMRIFGTREEMLAQGEDYESPIGGMFTRAMERFRAAEEVRREERRLRQVLDDEARNGGEEAQRLAELEGRQRDVWGVPQRPPQSVRGDPTQTDAGSAREQLHTLLTQQHDNVRQTNVTSNQPPAEAESSTPSLLSPTGDEAMLEEYYAMLRRQDRSQHAPGIETNNTAGGDTQLQSDDNFPRNMLNAIVAARERELVERNAQTDDSPPESQSSNDRRTPAFSRDAWWHQDADRIIRALTTNDELRDEVGMSQQDASVLLTYFIEDVISESDRMTIDSLLRNSTVVWRTGMPSEWLQRRREQLPDATSAEALYFAASQEVSGSADWAEHHNPFMRTEVVAQAFQMSSEIRRLARDLTPPERLQMLYRLQASERSEADVRILEHIRDDELAFVIASDRYWRATSLRRDENESFQRRLLDEVRQSRAQDGDHSRQELNDRRRDAHSFALAAGRQAMLTGSQTLIERMADRDEGTQAAYRRLQDNSFMNRSNRPTLYRQLTLSDYLEGGSDTESDSGSDKEDNEANARGLDARHTGRPDPKADEELKVQMECKICYTQLAEVACLPCGHLVMCRWCSHQHSPCLQHDQTRPRRAAGCPVCRKGIRQKVRVYRA